MTGKDNSSPEAVFNTIAVLAIDNKTGAIVRVGGCDSGGNMPWTHTFASNSLF
jgi:hypothetical protein